MLEAEQVITSGAFRSAAARELAPSARGDGPDGRGPRSDDCSALRNISRIFSWNVNGIRAVLRKGALQKFLQEYQPDILCLQEIKAKPEQVDYDFPGYRVFWNPAERPGYSGTAILISERLAPSACDAADFSIAVAEGRVQVADFGEFYLVNVYTPNSKPNLSRLTLREREWDPGFLALLQELEKHKSVVTCGDFNAAHTEIDLARPAANHHSAGFTDEERQGITEILRAGFRDTFRDLHPGVQRYTWWSHWGQARANNIGWRIDYFFVSGALAERVSEAEIYENVTGSDHCPVSVTLDLTGVEPDAGADNYSGELGDFDEAES